MTDSIDTTTAGGRFYFHMMGARAEFARASIVERTRAGTKAVTTRGIKVGRSTLHRAPAFSTAQAG
ncbi:MAG: recombinase family protein [Acetobacteraceae bacterium]